MTEIKIKKITLDDIDQLQKIGRQTFYETFSDGNTEENMTKYLYEYLTKTPEKIYKGLGLTRATFYRYAKILDNHTNQEIKQMQIK